MMIHIASRKIELTKKEMAEASRFGSKAYKDLQKARHDNPGFQVVCNPGKGRQKRTTHKGLTYEYMERYIAAHDEDGSVMAEYRMIRGISDNPAEEMPVAYTYMQMKRWFLNKYEAVAKFCNEVA